MDALRIRPASPKDLSALQAIERLCFPAQRQSSRSSLKNSLNRPNHFVSILEHPDSTKEPAGAVVLIGYKHTLRIYSIAIHPGFRGRGWGSRLMKHIEETARSKGYDKITLEVDAESPRLIEWYKHFHYTITEQLEDYYGEGETAYRMVRILQTPNTSATGNLVVVDQARKWRVQPEGVEIVSARDYLASERFRNSERFHVLNLCNSYKTLSLGYYVSLLASARNHRVVPSVMTLKDISNLSIAQSVADEIKDFIEKKLKTFKATTIEIPVLLGNSPLPEYADLAKKLFTLFEIPFFAITFSKKDTWKIKKLVNLSPSFVAQTYPGVLAESLTGYFQKKRFRRTQLKKYKYDLAILVNPEEKTPPSCPAALEKFRAAGEAIGFFVEFINKIDYRRICEFDALFIRETTAIENHTYKFARHAHTEGLVVIDDPWSILRCSNKIFLHERLSRARIKQPRTWLLTEHALSPKLIGSLSFPLVLKLPESSFSQGVYRVGNVNELHEKLHAMFKKGDLVIAQEFLESAFDWRIGILDHTPLFACKYYMANGHWQIYNWSNNNTSEFSGGSECVPINQVPEQILKTAVKASSLIGDGLYGVDLKEIRGQAHVIEINDNPNIDAAVEDQILQDELYLRIMTSFFNRIERERNQPRYLQ